MKDEPENSTNDHLIDMVAAQLREEAVPAMPTQLLEGKPEMESLLVRKAPRITLLTWAIGIAAAIFATIGVASMILPQRGNLKTSSGNQPQEIRERIAIDPTKIQVQNLIALRPFEDLEAEIAQMQSEIELLKMEAVSLDAIRKIDAMMAKN